MDYIEKTHRSLMFRFGSSTGKGNFHSNDNHTPLENFVPRNLKKILLTPHQRIHQLMGATLDRLDKGMLEKESLERFFASLKKAICEDWTIANRQIQQLAGQKMNSLLIREVALSVLNLKEAVDNCMGSLQENVASDLKEGIRELQKRIEEHEQSIENLVNSNEMEGWLLIQRFSGPFSPLVETLGWGITMFLAGLVSRRSFKGILDSLEKEFRKSISSFQPALFFSLPWKKAEEEGLAALRFVRATFFNADALAGGVIDPITLSGCLGVLAKALCQLNILAACFHPEKAKEEKEQAFSCKVQIFAKNNKQHICILNVQPDFFPGSAPIPKN